MSSNTSSLPNLTLVKAGAGAGKTYRIQKTLTQWVKAKKIQADRILAVSFTNAAANEMQSRIRQNLMSDGQREAANAIQNATISTIHGFGVKVIESFAYEKGLAPHPRQLTEAEQNHLLRSALTQVQAINPLLDELDKFGYTGKFLGSNYEDGASLLKRTVMKVIQNLRTLGKGDQPTQTPASIKLIKQAKETLEVLYGKNISKAETLDKALWSALVILQNAYPDKELLSAEWGSNAKTRAFVEAAYHATESNIKNNWTLWTQLQTIDTAPKINGKGKVLGHPQAQLAYDVWAAADKLSVHPGPLNDALTHIEALLSTAIEALSLYQTLKTQAGLVDFGDMVHLAERILAEPHHLAEAIKDYDCLIIDEFQDTNPLQFTLLRQFQKAGLPTLIVGDLKQSVMGFQGSDARLFASLLQQGEHDANVVVDVLPNNWRSTPALMKFINAMGIELYQDGYQPLSVTDEAAYVSELPALQICDFDPVNWSAQRSKNKSSIQAEGQFALAKHLFDLLQQEIQITDKDTGTKRPLKPSDIAVLAPKHSRLESFAAQLKKLGIATKLSQTGWLESAAVNWVLSAMQCVFNPNNQFALLNLLTSEYANASLQNALDQFMQDKCFEHSATNKLQAIARQLRLADVKSAVLQIIVTLDIWQVIEQRSDGLQQRANLLKLIQLAEDFNQAQLESLEAMGIYGKNLETFRLWLVESGQDDRAEIHKQPHAELNADQAVVLSTWHASKGLEWPIVLILDIHEERKAKVPSIDMAYLSQEVDGMLQSSFVQLLMDFDDKTTQQKMLDALAVSNHDTLKNLSYVTMTRAREHLILPWFDNGKNNTLMSLIQPLLDQPDFEVHRKNMITLDEPAEPSEESTRQKLVLTKRTASTSVKSVISPSLLDKISNDETLQTQVFEVSQTLDLSTWDKILPANEIGNLVHRCYEVYTQNPKRIETVFGLLPLVCQDVLLLENLKKQLKDNQDWLKNTFKATQIKCEVPILALNELGQTISGNIDMLVETEQGYWIIDHKTDQKFDFKKHYTQLQNYAQALKLDKPVLGVALNWVRAGKLEILKHKE